MVKSHEMDSLWVPVRNSGGHIITLFKEYSYLIDYILSYCRVASCNNFVYQKTLINDIYPSLMTKVNVSATVGMSATVGKLNML